MDRRRRDFRCGRRRRRPRRRDRGDDLARRGRKVALLDKAGRIKPCGGAIPPRLIRDFAIPDHLLRARVHLARMISPSGAERRHADRGRLCRHGRSRGFRRMAARPRRRIWRERVSRRYEKITRDGDGVVVHYEPKDGAQRGGSGARASSARTARFPVGRQEVRRHKTKFVFAYHEIVRSPRARRGDARSAAKSITGGRLSPDFYAWIFPHGDTMSVGTGSADKGFSLKTSVKDLRELTACDATGTLRKEGAPIPLKPLRAGTMDATSLLAGDAAGVVAPASGEGIYYAMLGGRLSADATERVLAHRRRTNPGRRAQTFHEASRARLLGARDHAISLVHQRQAARELRQALPRPDIQRLTWEAYMNKELVRADPMAHVRIFFKDLAHLFRLVLAMIDVTSDRWLEIGVAIAAVAIVALVGGLMTDVGEWYESLRFPAFRPPNWLFGPAWTVIFALIATSGVIAGIMRGDSPTRRTLLALFAVNGVLNLLWSPLFFKLRRPDWAFYELLAFWLSVLALVVFISGVSTTAAWIIAPYLAWVSFAGLLNWRVVQLNKPFGARGG